MVYRDAVQLTVRAPPDEVVKLLRTPGVLASIGLGDTIGEARMDAVVNGAWRATSLDGEVSLLFRATPVPGGTRLAVSADARPDSPLDAITHMVFPQRMHHELEARLDRLRLLAEALHPEDPPSPRRSTTTP